MVHGAPGYNMPSGAGTQYDVSGTAHPGLLKVEDTASIKIPQICLPSGEDGTLESRNEYKSALHSSGQDVVFESFEDVVHGWMDARADLEKEDMKASYERGYDTVAGFFGKHLKAPQNL